MVGLMFDPALLETPLINRLHDIPERDSFVSEENLRLLAAETARPLAELHGFISFLTHSEPANRGKARSPSVTAPLATLAVPSWSITAFVQN